MTRARALAEQIIRDVAELPNRTSPEDWPEAMLVTSEELTPMLEAFAAEVRRETIEACLMVVKSNQASRPDDWNKYHPFTRLGHHMAGEEIRTAIRALLSAPPAEAPDPTVALARLFATYRDEIPLRMLLDVGLYDANVKLTPLGRAALRLAEEGR